MVHAGTPSDCNYYNFRHLTKQVQSNSVTCTKLQVQSNSVNHSPTHTAPPANLPEHPLFGAPQDTLAHIYFISSCLSGHLHDQMPWKSLAHTCAFLKYTKPSRVPPVIEHTETPHLVLTSTPVIPQGRANIKYPANSS